VNFDEIHWWIFKRETDIEEFYKKLNIVKQCSKNKRRLFVLKENISLNLIMIY